MPLTDTATAVNKVLRLRSIGFCENEIVLDVETLVQIRSTPKIDNQITEVIENTNSENIIEQKENIFKLTKEILKIIW